jgi:hypothetical protein
MLAHGGFLVLVLQGTAVRIRRLESDSDAASARLLASALQACLGGNKVLLAGAGSGAHGLHAELVNLHSCCRPGRNMELLQSLSMISNCALASARHVLSGSACCMDSMAHGVNVNVMVYAVPPAAAAGSETLS